MNHAQFAQVLAPNNHQKPIANALATLFLKDLRKKLESLYVVKTQNLINKVKFCLKNSPWNVKNKEFGLNYTQRYASFGTGSSENNARTSDEKFVAVKGCFYS